MILLALALALAVALAQDPSPWPRPVDQASDAAFCNVLLRVAADFTPWWIGETMRVDGLSVSCSRRTISYDKSVLAPVSGMREGWREEMQEDWDGFVCNKHAYRSMASRGWRFAQNLTFESGERITQEARC